MKTAVISICMFLCSIATHSAFAASQDETCNLEMFDSGKKVYVETEQIHFANQKIYINTDGIICETPALFSDENGYYVFQVAGSGDCSWYEWQCKKCKECNLRGVDWECKRCHRPISQ